MFLSCWLNIWTKYGSIPKLNLQLHLCVVSCWGARRPHYLPQNTKAILRVPGHFSLIGRLKIISHLVSAGCQPHHPPKPVTPRRGQQLARCLPHSHTVESVSDCMRKFTMGRGGSNTLGGKEKKKKTDWEWKSKGRKGGREGEFVGQTRFPLDGLAAENVPLLGKWLRGEQGGAEPLCYYVLQRSPKAG